MILSTSYHKIKPSTSWITFIFSLRVTLFILSIPLSANNLKIIIEWSLSRINTCNLILPIILDPIGLVFTSTVTFITANILIFSKFYINNNLHMSRFTHLVIIFVISINLLILSPNIISIIIGWDGLGISRFLLVIYFHNPKSLKSGLITALTNRIGDTFILFTIALLISQGQWHILATWANQTYLILFIILAAITKTAQIPFSAWLPEAIAAPTPVSALVHSSTLVTAGVFLLIRFRELLLRNPSASQFLAIAAILTRFQASSWAIVNNDPKKVVALSTIRQLGLIIATVRIGAPYLAFLHLITHAIFKSLLFVCIGYAIDFKNHQQNFFGMETKYSNPLVTVGILCSLTSINAFPTIAGYYSKDLILEYFMLENETIPLGTLLLLGTSANTAIYSVRIWRATVIAFNPWAWKKTQPASTLKRYKIIAPPVFILSLGAITSGSLIQWLTLPYLHTFPTSQLLHFIPLMITLTGATFALSICTSLKTNWNPFNTLKKIYLIHFATCEDKNPTKFFLSDAPYSLYDKTTWPFKPGSKSTTTPFIVAYNRYLSRTLGGMSITPNIVAQYSLLTANLIVTNLENGWLQFYGPSKTLSSLIEKRTKTLPNITTQLIQFSITPLIILALIIILLIK